MGWQSIQAVGGIAFESAEQRPSGWFLPVRVDLSGTDTVTHEPLRLNSSLVCERTSAVIEGINIYLSISARPAHSGLGARCPEANLGALTEGSYRVFYRSRNEPPVFLGDLTIEVRQPGQDHFRKE